MTTFATRFSTEKRDQTGLTSRSRLRTYGIENGYSVTLETPDPDADTFTRGDRTVVIRYTAEERILEILVNGVGVVGKDRSSDTHHRSMAKYQRAGIGLVYGDDGHWVADHLAGPEKVRAEALADRKWTKTHRHCPQSARVIENPLHCLTVYSCPECGQRVGLDANGRVLSHFVRTNVVQLSSRPGIG